MRLRKLLWFAVPLLLCWLAPGAQAGTSNIRYFDPHNHLSGVLPYEAYTNLPAYIRGLEGKGKGATAADERALYTYIREAWDRPSKEYNGRSRQQYLGNRPFAPDQRYALGARATLELYSDSNDPNVVSGALQRIFTATPFTEFDSAYAFRGGYGDAYLKHTYYPGSGIKLASDLCKATILELADTDIRISEQSMNFIGGWKFDKNGKSYRLNNILCYGDEPQRLKPILKKMGKPVPSIRILLMTHTSELGENTQGSKYASFARTGICRDEPLAGYLKTGPEVIKDALLGLDANGKSVVSKARMRHYFNTVVGIDTAAPEVTCFSAAGMDHYKRLVEGVYEAAKERRRLGWHGKLLVHTHVGEGFTIYYAKHPPLRPWTFKAVFGSLPDESGNEITNPKVARRNIATLLAAIASIERTHKDIHDYLVFRLGHVTWATQAEADAMAKEQVEADVNLDSNIATNAYPLSRMKNRSEIVMRLNGLLRERTGNLGVNDFPHFVIPDPRDIDEVGHVLGNTSLKYLLMAHVRVLLGSDGAGVEHSGMRWEYRLGTSLIRYWHQHDPGFRARAGNVTEQYYFDNVNWHLKNMSTDTYLPYY